MATETNKAFYSWLLENTTLSENSAKKYESGVRVVSDEMLQKGVITKPLAEHDSTELAISIFVIFNNRDFITKNTVGNNMYSNSLKNFQAFKKSTQGIGKSDNAVKEIQENTKLSNTEKEAIIKARVGQGTFRSCILKKYDGKCIITNISDKRLLVASHIKPWAVSDNDERLDAENGFLLNCLYDRMFDLGLITFSERGKIVISSTLKTYDRAIIKIDTEQEFDLRFSEKLLRNLEYHRDIVFLK